QMKVAEIKEVPDETIIEEEIEIELDMEVTEFTSIDEIEFVESAIEDEPVEEVFTVVEVNPEYPGGIAAFYQFIGERIKYPNSAARMGVEGRVYVEFIVGKDGALRDIRVVKGIGAGCDEEAERVMKMVPKFNPGKQRGRPVHVKMVLPVYFKLME
ncbi:MAG: energy transducer TonB, partial [Cyclobacteriaceae bacterium]